VPDQDFMFALDMSAAPPYDMLADLARSVLGHVGYGAAEIDALNRELRAALSERAAHGERRCDVRFIAHAGELQIVVAAAGRPEWRTIRPLPVA
jgi:hypothetical protein